MDLSWCIICDNRVDDVLNDSSLYCSDSCRLKDQMASITNQLNINYQQQQQQKKTTTVTTKPTTSTTLLRNKQRTSAPSASYPWVPLYRRRRGVVVSKRCQPVVASSYTTASASLSQPKPTIA